MVEWYIHMKSILSGLSIEDFQLVLGKKEKFQRAQIVHLCDLLLRLDRGNQWIATYSSLEAILKKMALPMIEGITSVGKAKKCGANGCAYLKAIYNKNSVVVKAMKKPKIVETFYEILVNMILAKQTNTYIMAPKIYRMGYYKFPGDRHPKLVTVQEKLDGDSLKTLDESTLKDALVNLCDGLYKLRYNAGISFSHRDLHTDNLMYDKKRKKIYLLDFGYSCVTMGKTCGSIQFKKPAGLLLDPEKTCNNEVHDVCLLLLWLRMEHSYPWLVQACKTICTVYYEKYEEDYGVMQYKGIKPYTWEKFKNGTVDFFHPWYMYKLYKVNTRMTLRDIQYYLAPTKEQSLAERLGSNWGGLKL
tara:strand:+ start:1498 stop:2574 length:1077 start_codon:yes stop_codon:yes gene_type:complete